MRSDRFIRGMATIAALALALGLAGQGRAWAAEDVLGVNGMVSLGPLSTADPATYPQGTTSAFRYFEIPLPEDGVLVFDSINLAVRNGSNGTVNDIGSLTVAFKRNKANTPVTLISKGDITIGQSVTLHVNGENGQNGAAGNTAYGGLGGPGGFRGGDGAYPAVNFANQGGAGLGPGGGAPGSLDPLGEGQNGVFFGTPDLLPLVGGSGGGGGSSVSNANNAVCGGGGGGGGAILIAANGKITLIGTVAANGGSRGSGSNGGTYAGGGAGGAVRMIASILTGDGGIQALGGTGVGGIRAPTGAVRLEAFTNELSASIANPFATRAPAPGPLTNPISTSVAITSVGGEAVPPIPEGGYGKLDVVLPTPGVKPIGLAASMVPIGTYVKLTIKPRVGGPAVVQNVLLEQTGADAEGNWQKSVVVDLPAGAYTLEVQATMRTDP